METWFEGILILFTLAVGVPILLIAIGVAIHIIKICWFIGEKLEQYICEKINKQIYDKQKRLRKEIDGD